jgi:hypothetical protein
MEQNISWNQFRGNLCGAGSISNPASEKLANSSVADKKGGKK